MEIRDFDSMIKSIGDVLSIYSLTQLKLNKQISIQKLIDNADRNLSTNQIVNEK